MQNAVLTLRGRHAWAHDYDPGRAVTAAFQALPGTSFVVNGARPNADSALVSAGGDMTWSNGFSAGGDLRGRIRRPCDQPCRQGRRPLRVVNGTPWPGS